MKAPLVVLLAVGLTLTTTQISTASNVVNSKNASNINKPAKMKKYQWATELCENEAYYDASKISVQNIEDGFEIFKRLTQVNLPNYAPYTPKELRQLSSQSIGKLEKDYLQLSTQVERLTTIPKQTNFDMSFFKKKLQQDITNEYQLNRLGLMAYLDIGQALKAAPKVCQEYLIPLNQSPEKLQAAWMSYTLEHIRQQEKIGNTDYRKNAMNRYRSEKAEDAVSYAKLGLVGYAWNNCLNNHYSKQELNPEQVNKAQQVFEKIVFKNTIKSKCEMP
ncbi:hypothetical protein [Psychrobacter sp. DAB_AL32B]|uniref:hypothetical protein n=1 Tax=Psychrobacter sp. DAB_AL32B TaxID=1028414 RepID=UPI000B7E4A30|nr:hypothetical protein [Psychrobacter sp. DAB_AL32B]OXL18736.1 hypothetical protein CAN34_12055 [Psychrobacter sp. DAB_AL32B]